MIRFLIHLAVLMAFITLVMEVDASNKLIVDGVSWIPIAKMDTPTQILGKSVGMVQIPNKRERCTGFFIKPDIILTASHCIRNDHEAKRVSITISKLNSHICDKLLKTDRYFDYTLLKCRTQQVHFVPVQKNRGKKLQKLYPGQNIKVIHVNCDWLHNRSCSPEKLVSKNYIHRIWYRDFLHQADTLGGSSGAPVFNENNQLIGIHHSGSIINYRDLNGPYNFTTKLISIDNFPEWVYTR